MAKKWLIFIATIGLIFIAYRLIGVETLRRSFNHSLETPIDMWIPFMPATVIFYVTIYFFWLPLILSRNVNVRQYSRIIAAVALAFAITFTIHIIIPSAYPRPTISAAEARSSWSDYILKKVYATDLPNNTFPSSHVVAAVTLTIMAYPYLKKTAFAVYAAWGAAISMSTLTVKQHYLIDVVVGVLVAVISCQLVKIFWPTPSSSKANPKPF